MSTCMKKYSIRIYICHLALLSILSAGWWGILYPDFSFSEDTFSVTTETEQSEKEMNKQAEKTDQQPVQKLTGSEAFFALLEAAPDEIEIRSKFLDEVFNIRGRENEQQRTHRDF